MKYLWFILGFQSKAKQNNFQSHSFQNSFSLDLLYTHITDQLSMILNSNYPGLYLYTIILYSLYTFQMVTTSLMFAENTFVLLEFENLFQTLFAAKPYTSNLFWEIF